MIANAGWTRFSKFADLDALSEEEWDKCWAVNVKGPLALLRAAMPTFDANEDGGVCLITSSVAGRILSGSSMAYSVTKAAQLHLMRCMAKTQGKKVRVNAVLPGLLLTEWVCCNFRDEEMELMLYRDCRTVKRRSRRSRMARPSSVRPTCRTVRIRL